MQPNRILYADDCLNVLRDPLAIPPQSVDLIYLDPPFNSKSDYNLPFKGKYKSAKPVAVFKDTWRWGDPQDDALARLRAGPATKPIAQLIDIARQLESPNVKHRLDAYLVNMAERLIAMKQVLKPTGSIYLHCDPTASHYLKALMDLIFKKRNCRNEIVWCYERGGRAKTLFSSKHDNILFYTAGTQFTFNADDVRLPRKKTHMKIEIDSDGKEWQVKTDRNTGEVYRYGVEDGALCPDWWTGIQQLNRSEQERLGYPTQKPTQLLSRIIRASSNPGDILLDPFCGCGTSIQAAEQLGRRWIGIDIARFSTGLVQRRLLNDSNLNLSASDVSVFGVPETPEDARQLAEQDKFEFEKWACGAVGAEGMFHDPGTKGADGGVDGVLKFYPLQWGKRPSQKQPDIAIVQVKGGG